MKREFPTILIGVLFLAAGLAIGGVFLDLIKINVNLAGWWTIFIIAPALYSIAQSGINVGNLIMLSVGTILLMNAQNILPVTMTWKLIFPVVLIAIGFQLLFGGTISGTCRKEKKHESEPDNKTGTQNRYTAFFSGQDIHYGSEVFSGATYTATFGGITADLRNSTLNGDVVILVSALFGGIDIILPENVKVVSHVMPILGGMESKYKSSRDPSAHTVIIRGSATFGGITVK